MIFLFMYVGGIPGVGKTTIIQEVLRVAQMTDLPVEGMKERKVLYELTNVTSSEQYRILPEVVRAGARREMVARFYIIDREDPKTIRIRDDHFVCLRGDGNLSVRQYEPSDKDQILAMAVVIAEPEVILARRLREMNARLDRGFPDCSILARHQNLEVEMAFSQARNLEVPIQIFNNEEGEIKQLAQTILSFISEVTKQQGD